MIPRPAGQAPERTDGDVGLRVRIGGDGPVVAESDETGWRLIVRGQVDASGVYPGDLYIALRDFALRARHDYRLCSSWHVSNTGGGDGLIDHCAHTGSVRVARGEHCLHRFVGDA